MFSLLIIFSFFWLISITKKNLFWFYFWQLKQYRSDRILEHFKRKSGRRLLFNYLFLRSIFLFLFLIDYLLLKLSFFVFLFGALLIFYILDSLKFLKSLWQKKAKFPLFTKKILFLFSAISCLGASFPFLIFSLFSQTEPTYFKFFFSFFLLIFDFSLPLFVTLSIFFSQPFVFLWKYYLVRKAKKKIREFNNLLIIGITGSYGKTSTKEFLAQILSKKYKVLKTKSHQNTEVPISLCILNELKKEHQIFICEMAGYKKEDIKFLSEIVNPKIGIITGINEQHLALFGSMENLILAEGGKLLIENLPSDGLVIFNGNNKFCQSLFKETKIKKKIVFKKENFEDYPKFQPDLWAEEIKVERFSLSFKVFSKEGDFAQFKMNLLGSQNIENLLLASCCAKELGFTLREIAKISEKFRPLPNQMEPRKTKTGINLIDSCYSTNPNAVFSHLEYLKCWPKKRILIMPCLIELGEKAEIIHQRIGKKIAEICDLGIIVTEDYFEEIKKGAQDVNRKEILHLENPQEIYEKLKKICQKEDVILIEGRVQKEIINLLMKL